MPDFWGVESWKEAYGITNEDPICQAVLLDADERMAAYCDATAYATAVAGGTATRLFTRVNGELALYYLDRRPQLAPKQVEESRKEYAGVKKYMQKYRPSSLMAQWTEDEILAQLIEYKTETGDSASFASAVTWGTGRFVSGSLTIDESSSE